MQEKVEEEVTDMAALQGGDIGAVAGVPAPGQAALHPSCWPWLKSTDSKRKPELEASALIDRGHQSAIPYDLTIKICRKLFVWQSVKAFDDGHVVVFGAQMPSKQCRDGKKLTIKNGKTIS